MNKKALWESIKEPLRLAVLLIVSELIVVLAGIPQIYAVLITIILRGVDKFLHELSKETGNKTLETGLTRF